MIEFSILTAFWLVCCNKTTSGGKGWQEIIFLLLIAEGSSCGCVPGLPMGTKTIFQLNHSQGGLLEGFQKPHGGSQAG